MHQLPVLASFQPGCQFLHSQPSAPVLNGSPLGKQTHACHPNSIIMRGNGAWRRKRRARHAHAACSQSPATSLPHSWLTLLPLQFSNTQRPEKAKDVFLERSVQMQLPDCRQET